MTQLRQLPYDLIRHGRTRVIFKRLACETEAVVGTGVPKWIRRKRQARTCHGRQQGLLRVEGPGGGFIRNTTWHELSCAEERKWVRIASSTNLKSDEDEIPCEASVGMARSLKTPTSVQLSLNSLLAAHQGQVPVRAQTACARTGSWPWWDCDTTFSLGERRRGDVPPTPAPVHQIQLLSKTFAATEGCRHPERPRRRQ